AIRSLCVSVSPPTPSSTLFPYTTLFRSTDYPRTRPDLPNHEPRGCSRGASYSWYLYSGNRVKYPLVRSRLLKLWRQARAGKAPRSEEHTSELQSQSNLVCRLLLEKKKNT